MEISTQLMVNCLLNILNINKYIFTFPFVDKLKGLIVNLSRFCLIWRKHLVSRPKIELFTPPPKTLYDVRTWPVNLLIIDPITDIIHVLQ